VKWVLNEHDWKSIEIQRSKKFWQEPKALLVTLAVCCLAPWVQGQLCSATTSPKVPNFLQDGIRLRTETSFGLKNSVLSRPS